jgi:hypothetical protein
LEYVGCWVFPFRGTWEDRREAARIDADFFVGNHSLRGGLDAEVATSTVGGEHSGGIYYRYFMNGIEGNDPETYIFEDLPWDQELVRRRYFSEYGEYQVSSESAYAQDSWAVTPNLTVNLGLRWEQFRVTNTDGKTFLSVSDQIAPRLGVVWDLSGTGRSKVYGSFGIYHLPVSTAVMGHNQVGEWTWYRDWFPLEGGILPDGSPEAVGPQIGETQLFFNGEVPDPRLFVDSSLDPMSQDELIVGYERTIGANWTVGMRMMARRFNHAIEDIDISRALWEVYGYEPCSPENFPSPGCGFYSTLRITNPGTDFHGSFDLDGDLQPDEVVLTADELGIPEPIRNYRAVELTFQRRFANGWMLQGSYTLSRLEGNYGGTVNSDIGQDLPNLNIDFDLAGQMEHSRGYLPNDRRHNLKLFGAYQWNFGLQLGGNFWYRSGRPVNGFGMHPTDPWTQAWSKDGPLNGPYSFYNTGEACPRGCGGTTPGTWALDLSARYDFAALGVAWYARLDVFNVFDNDEVVQIEDVAEDEYFVPNPNYLEPRFFQPPRSIRIGFGVSF